jgi:hypothetical protein
MASKESRLQQRGPLVAPMIASASAVVHAVQ